MKKILFLASALALLTQCKPANTTVVEKSSDPTSAYAHVSSDGVSPLLEQNKDLIILDVRTPEEHASGHIIGSKNINFFDDSFKEQIGALDKSKKYLIHCRSGGRSTKAANIMAEMGFTDLIHLDGGYNGYMSASHSNK